jgi:hypothetical protein
MEIKKRFPESEGFEVSATEWKALGYDVNIDKKRGLKMRAKGAKNVS